MQYAEVKAFQPLHSLPPMRAEDFDPGRDLPDIPELYTEIVSEKPTSLLMHQNVSVHIMNEKIVEPGVAFIESRLPPSRERSNIVHDYVELTQNAGEYSVPDVRGVSPVRVLIEISATQCSIDVLNLATPQGINTIRHVIRYVASQTKEPLRSDIRLYSKNGGGVGLHHAAGNLRRKLRTDMIFAESIILDAAQVEKMTLIASLSTVIPPNALYEEKMCPVGTKPQFFFRLDTLIALGWENGNRLYHEIVPAGFLTNDPVLRSNSVACRMRVSHILSDTNV